MKKILDFIAEDIQTRMTRLGIVANFHAVEPKVNLSNSYKIVSSDFIMTPMIFKNIHAEVKVFVSTNPKDEDCKFISCFVNLHYNTWNNGMNGFEFGKFCYTISNEWFDEDEPCCINMASGIEI